MNDCNASLRTDSGLKIATSRWLREQSGWIRDYTAYVAAAVHLASEQVAYIPALMHMHDTFALAENVEDRDESTSLSLERERDETRRTCRGSETKLSRRM